MSDLITQLDSAREVLTAHFGAAPAVAIVCGSGFQFLEEATERGSHLTYGEIPNFRLPSNAAHKGHLRVAELAGTRAALLLGRFHGYEGYPPGAVVFPVRALAHWGVHTFLLTNAAGGIREGMAVGDLMMLSDHINLLGWNPLTGPNVEALGKRFPDMSCAYDRGLRAIARGLAQGEGSALHEGVYAAVPGPSYETPAEIRMLAAVGADAVGMSTVPETIALRHMDRRVFAVSCITNRAAGLSHATLDDSEVVEVLKGPHVQRSIVQVLSAVARGAAHG